MVRKPGSKHSAPSSRVTARRNDWNSICDLHQGPRSMAASRGRIHDRSPIRLPNHQKALAERGPSIHDESKDLPLRPANHRHQLRDLLALVRFVAAGDGVLDAMGDVVLQDLFLDTA